MKLPRGIPGTDVVRALEKLGFTAVRQSGSHIRLVRGSQRVTVPNHESLAPGTLKSILRQAEIDVDVFVKNL